MTSDSLPPAPTPEADPPEPQPGGVDSLDDPRYGTAFGPPTTPDVRPEDNPVVEDVVPDEVTAPDAKQQESEGPDSGSGETPVEPTD